MQSGVYEECVRPLVASCLEGYNVTVLAYGQTGSGKSYTMGSEDTLGILTSDRRGVIPRYKVQSTKFIQVTTRMQRGGVGGDNTLVATATGYWGQFLHLAFTSRSLEELFNCIVSKKAELQHTVHVSYLEIYKEELRDLLLGRVASGVGPHELNIRETEGGNTGK